VSAQQKNRITLNMVNIIFYKTCCDLFPKHTYDSTLSSSSMSSSLSVALIIVVASADEKLCSLLLDFTKSESTDWNSYILTELNGERIAELLIIPE